MVVINIATTIDLATYSYNLELKDNSFTSGMQIAEGNVEKLQSRMGNFSSFLKTSLVAGLASASAAISGLVITGIKDAAEAEEKVKQLEAVLKSTGQAAGITKDQALDLADAFEKTTKFSAEQTLEGENLLLTFTNIGKEVFPQVTETMLDMSQALGQSTKASATQLGKALNDPINGITALSRVGVSFTEEQKNQIKTLQESGNVMGAQKIILAELGKEFGGSATAAGETFTGQLEITKNMLGQVSEAVGSKLMPYLMNFLKFVQNNMPAIQSIVDTVFNAIGIAFSGVGTNISALIQTLQIFYKNNKAIFDGIALVIQNALSIIQSVFKAFMALLKGDWSAFGTELKNITEGIFSLIQDVFNLGVEAIKTVLKNAITSFKTLGNNIMNALLDAFKSIWTLINSWFSNSFNGLITWFTTLYEGFYNSGASIFTAVWDGIKSVWESLSNWISEKVEWIKDKLSVWNSAKSKMSEDDDTSSNIRSYAIGTTFVPQTGLALIHQGEAIIPSQYNPWNPRNNGGNSGVASNTVNHNYNFSNFTIKSNDINSFIKSIGYKVAAQG